MNIIKEMLNTPDTPSGKKKLNKLITKLGLGKKQKGDIIKSVVNNELGDASKDEYIYYKSTDSSLFAQIIEVVIAFGGTIVYKAQPYNDDGSLKTFIYFSIVNQNSTFKNGSKILGLRYLPFIFNASGNKISLNSIEDLIELGKYEQQVPGISNSFQRCSKDEFYNINI